MDLPHLKRPPRDPPPRPPPRPPLAEHIKGESNEMKRRRNLAARIFNHNMLSTSSCLCAAILYFIWEPDSSLENWTAAREKKYKLLLQRWRGMIVRCCSFCKTTILFKAYTSLSKWFPLETTTLNVWICIFKRIGQLIVANHKHQIVKWSGICNILVQSCQLS